MKQLPESWDIVTIADISRYIARGKSPRYIERSRLPVINQKAIRWSGIQNKYLRFVHPQQIEEWDKERYIQDGDILLNSTGTGTLGRACLVLPANLIPPKVVDSHVTIIRLFRDAVDPRYVFAWIRGPHIQDNLENLATGATNQIELSRTAIAGIELPLAPLKEQRRIADKLDVLLTRVNSCQSRLEHIPSLLNRFRQSVLAAAFRGELTKQNSDNEKASILINRIQTKNQQIWKKRFGSKKKYPEPELPDTKDLPALPSGWEWATPGQLASANPYALAIGPFGSNLMAKDYTRKGVPLIFIRNIRSGVFIDSNTTYVSKEKANELKAHKVVTGDILITKMGEPPGDATLYPEELPDAIATADCITWSLSPLLYEKQFFVHAIHSPVVKVQIARITKGVAQQKMSLARFKTLAVPVPPLAEQAEIVRRVENLFAYAERIETHYRSALERVKFLTPALLERAFRGELVEQDPSDEPVTNLLQHISEIRKLEDAMKKAQPRRKKEKRMSTNKKRQPLYETLIASKGERLTPDQLFSTSGYEAYFREENNNQEVLDTFYEELRSELQRGRIIEKRPNTKTVYLVGVKS